MNKPIKHIGNFEHKVNDVASEYENLALADEEAGVFLLSNGKYPHAAYFFVQAMEKYVRYRIFSLVNPNTEYFRKRTTTHSLDQLLDFLIEIVSSNSVVQEQVKEQLYTHVLGGVRFGKLHNDLRYPSFSDRYESYSMLRVTQKDAAFTHEKLQRLKNFLKDIHRLAR
ncbi:hypothetical protein NIES4075_65800 [Tolypothrix sp. NIES-4075]|uniref:HEPN domain-containing protein n=1 Tax=Tolypothrix sp. NIES-4075 TaxID=2005459 RepID=UPI000B5C3358|nr:HEPN domain-containing protein [Tolypothrix sp. NIES-4075]GAX45559.1 hypothetical protein NIES4075_65800 [Tolypothrix sp. NIES-4075]